MPRSRYFRNERATSSAEPTSQVVPAPPPNLLGVDAVEGVDCDIKRLTEVWIATNAQDAELAAVNHAGVRSMGYQPGSYAPSEFTLTNFTNWYAGKMAAYAGEPTPFRIAAE